jgi:hypothetical protein
MALHSPFLWKYGFEHGAGQVGIRLPLKPLTSVHDLRCPLQEAFGPEQMWPVQHFSVDADNAGAGIGHEGVDNGLSLLDCFL